MYNELKWLCAAIVMSVGMWCCTSIEVEKMRIQSYEAQDIPMCGYEVPNEQ